MTRYKKIKNLKGIRQDTNSGKYQATKTINSKDYSKTFESLREAKFWRNNFHPINSPNPKSSNPLKTYSLQNGVDKKITLHEVFERYKAMMIPTLGDNTAYRKVKAIERFCDEIWSIAICEISPEFLSKYILRKKDISIAMESKRCNFDRELKELSSVFNWYKEVVDHTFNNPIMRVHKKIGFIKDTPKIDKKVKPDEIIKFIDSFTEKQELYRDMAIIQFYGACRIHEVAGLLKKNINLVTRKMLINETMCWAKGKAPYIKPNTKTGEDKEVHIVDEMFAVLNKWLSKEDKSIDTVFHRNGEYIRYNAIHTNYKKALIAANLPYSGTHILRHSMATLTRKLGGMDAAQSVTGHKSQRMLEVYAGNDSANLNKESVIAAERFINKIRSDVRAEAKNLCKPEQEDCEVLKMPSMKG